MLIVKHIRYDQDSGYDLAVTIVDENGRIVHDEGDDYFGYIDFAADEFFIAEVDFNVTRTGLETIRVYKASAE